MMNEKQSAQQSSNWEENNKAFVWEKSLEWLNKLLFKLNLPYELGSFF